MADPKAPRSMSPRDVGEDFLFHLYRGSELLQDNRVHDAKAELEQALALQPSDPKGQDLLGVVYFRLGLYPHAIAIYERLIRMHPDAAEPRINLALSYLKTGQPAQARKALERVVKQNPKHSRAWGYLGLACQRMGDIDRATQAFTAGGHDAMARRLLDQSTSPTPPAPPVKPVAGNDGAKPAAGDAAGAAAGNAARPVAEDAATAAAEDGAAAAEDGAAAAEDGAAAAEDGAAAAEDGAAAAEDGAAAAEDGAAAAEDGAAAAEDGAAAAEDGAAAAEDGAAGGDAAKTTSADAATAAAGDAVAEAAQAPHQNDSRAAQDGSRIWPAVDTNLDLTPLPPPATGAPARERIAREAARDAPPPSVPASVPMSVRVIKATAPVPAATFTRDQLLVFPRILPVALHQSGLVLVQAASGFVTRMELVRSMAFPNGITTTALKRRLRGRFIDEPLGGPASPLIEISGRGELVLAPAAGQKLVPIMPHSDPLYLREDAVGAFELLVAWESGRVAVGDGDAVSMMLLRGDGSVIASVPERVCAIEIMPGKSSALRIRTVIGWVGRVVPRPLLGSEAPAGERGFVAFTGEGMVLLDGR